MEIQQIGNGKVVIYIKGEELKCLPAFLKYHDKRSD